MSENDSAWQSAWKRGQAAQTAQDRKIAALNKKNSRGGRGARSLTSFKKKRVSRATSGQGSWAGRTVSFLYKKHRGAARGDRYMNAAKNSVFISSSMLGRNPSERKVEWLMDCARHPNVLPDRLIVHCSISRPAGFPLTNEEWSRYIETYLEELGAHGVNYVATLHPEKHSHCHLVYSRALANGQLLCDSQDYWKGRAAALEAGRKLGLLVDGPAENAERPAHTSTSDTQVNASRRAARRGTPDGFIDRQTIQTVLATSASMDLFAAGLKDAGIEMRLAQKNGRVTGVMFKQASAQEYLAGSTIDRSFSLPKVQAQIELNRHRQMLSKKEQELLLQRQRQELQQRQAAQRPTYDRPRGG